MYDCLQTTIQGWISLVGVIITAKIRSNVYVTTYYDILLSGGCDWLTFLELLKQISLQWHIGTILACKIILLERLNC